MAPQPQSDQPDRPGQQDTEAVEFPVDHLAKLDDQLNRPKWVVPVRPDDDLERLLRAAIKLCQEGEYNVFLDGYMVPVVRNVYLKVKVIISSSLSLTVSISLSGRDVNSEPCQRFFREGLTTSFVRILTDDAVSTWKPDIQVI